MQAFVQGALSWPGSGLASPSPALLIMEPVFLGRSLICLQLCLHMVNTGRWAEKTRLRSSVSGELDSQIAMLESTGSALKMRCAYPLV